MPRQNRARTIAGEAALARRIAVEREARGMSYESLALRLTSAGCAIHPSALYKIEKGTPPRRITVDELIALSEVFAMTIEELLRDPLDDPDIALSNLVDEALDVEQEARDLSKRRSDVERRIRHLLKAHPQWGESYEELLDEGRRFRQKWGGRDRGSVIRELMASPIYGPEPEGFVADAEGDEGEGQEQWQA